MSAQPNPIIVDMSVQTNDVVVPMQVATQYDLPITLETLEADHNGDYSAPAGTAWDSAHVAVPETEINPLSVTQNGTYTPEQNKAFGTVTVNVQPPEPVQSKDVDFIDYDGTLLYSYTAAEFANLTEMPPNPTHDGLTAQGWNWTLADAKAYVAKYGIQVIGQMYVPMDGKTHLLFHLESPRLSPGVFFSLNGTAVVEWGDGSSETFTGANIAYSYLHKHTYEVSGDYEVKISVTGSLAYQGRIVQGSPSNQIYDSCLLKAHIGSNVVKLGDSAFRDCYNLTAVTIPPTVTEMVSSLCNSCVSLKALIIPSGIASTGNNLMTNGFSAEYVSLPNGVTDIATVTHTKIRKLALPEGITSLINYGFSNNWLNERLVIPDGVTSIGISLQYLYSLKSLILPSSLTSIAAQAFLYATTLRFIKFKASSPPTVANSNAFTGIPTDCIIYVPSGSLSAYTSAANYPSSSTYTYVEY